MKLAPTIWQQTMIRKWVVLFVALALSACSDLPDYHYKMTVHVATPDGDRAYSSVRGIHSEYVSSISSSSGRTIKDTLTGEAVIMDLPDGRTVYALLSRPDNPDYGTYVTGPALGPHIPHVTNGIEELINGKGAFLKEVVSRRKAMLALKGAYDLPRTVSYNPSHRTDYQPEQMWPMFVTFDDPTNPATVREVSPESIGVQNIKIEITSRPINDYIGQKLPWLDTYQRERRRLNGDRGNVVEDNEIKDVIGTGAFRQGVSK